MGIRFLSLINLLLIFSCCGTVVVQSQVSIDPAFEKQYKEFARLYAKPIWAVKIHFGSLPRPRVGECQNYISGRGEITIDRDYWSRAPESDKEQLIFHEMGHCVLKLGHKHGLHIMNPEMLPTDFYRDYRSELILDLLTQTPEDADEP